MPHRLLRAVDQRKDQSYVLYTMDQDQLGFITFPLGNLIKPEVRQLGAHLRVCRWRRRRRARRSASSARAPMPTSSRSGGPMSPGPARSSTRREPDRQHKGLVHHTIGQRKGIGIARPEPLYVLSLDTAKNRSW